MFWKGVNLLGLGFFENRELKIKLGDLVEKHNQSRKNQTKKKDSKTKCSVPTVAIWCSTVRESAPLTSFIINVHQMLKNSRIKKMNCEIRTDQFSLHILRCHLITVHWCPVIKKPATFLFQSDTVALLWRRLTKDNERD